MRGDLFHDTLAPHVERGDVPGLVAAVEVDGEQYVEVLGTLAVGGGTVARDSIFRIASMTKPVTAAAALLLVEEGLLALDEPVDRLLPELADRRVLVRVDAPLDETVPALRPITLRDLLTFTAGIGVVMAPPDTYPIQRALKELALFDAPPRPSLAPDPDEWIRRLGTLPLVHQPGERWMYHIGSDILGVLVARAAEQPLEDVLHARIFEPLGMDDTAFFVPPEKLARFAESYVPNADGGLDLFDPAAGGDWSRAPAFPSGSGGLVSTVDDFLAFARMLLRGGSPILSSESAVAMTTDQLRDEQKSASSFVPGWFDRNGWGFGVGVLTQPDTGLSAGSYGWTGGLGTCWSNDPATGLVGVLLTQRSMTSPEPPPVFVDFWRAVRAALRR